MQVFALLVSVVARAIGLEAVFLGIAITMLCTTTLVAAFQRPLRSLD
jgi:hypothetical protein